MEEKKKKRTKCTPDLKVEVIGSPKEALDSLPKDLQDCFYRTIYERILGLHKAKQNGQNNANNNEKAEV